MSDPSLADGGEAGVWGIAPSPPINLRRRMLPFDSFVQELIFSTPFFVAFRSPMLVAADCAKRNLWSKANRLLQRTTMHWVACIAISIALHVAVLFAVGAMSIWPAGTAMPTEAMYVRLVSERPATDAAATRPRLEPLDRLSAPIQKRIRFLDLPVLPANLLTPPIFDEAQYTPSGRLTVRPSAVGEIAIPYPKGVDHRGVVKSMLTLFIDEKGTVVKVKMDESDLPAPFQDAAKHAFARARFYPGRIDDLPVRSRMRIEVTFESHMGR